MGANNMNPDQTSPMAAVWILIWVYIVYQIGYLRI